MPKPPQPPYLFPAGARLGADNVILKARARRHRVDSYAGPLSIKTVLAGEAAWTIAGRDLVVNAGEPYSITIDAPEPVETCCVFFAPGFVVAMDATSPLAESLAAPEHPAPSGFEEDFLLIGEDLLRYYAQIAAQAARLPAIRASTRARIPPDPYRSPPPPDPPASRRSTSIADSPAFGRTPHAYLTALRLGRARGS